MKKYLLQVEDIFKAADPEELKSRQLERWKNWKGDVVMSGPYKFSRFQSPNQEEPLGLVPNQVNMGYMGFTAWIKPMDFRRLAAHRQFGGEEVKKYKDAFRLGIPVAPPWLDAVYDPKDKSWFVYGHEGRTRTEGLLSLGYNQPIPVDIFPRIKDRGPQDKVRIHTLRSREVSEEMLDAFLHKPVKSEMGFGLSKDTAKEIHQGWVSFPIEKIEFQGKEYRP